MSTTMTSKGQVTIPKPIRDHLGIGPGSKIKFRLNTDGNIVVEVDTEDGSEPVQSRFSRFRGHAGKGLSTDEIMALLRDDT